jgi:ribosomal protein S1
MQKNNPVASTKPSPYGVKSRKLTSENAINHSLKVIERVKNLGNEGNPDFEWPATANEQRRIRQVTSDLRGKSIAESFAMAYGVREVFGAKENVERLQAITCKELKPGDVVDLRILAIDKKGVTFEQDAYKETIVSTVNLYQYPNFKKFIPKDPVKVKVMSRDLNKVYVDPLQPMVDEFIEKIQHLISIQANVKNPITTWVTGLNHMRAGYTGRIRIDNVSDFCGKDMYMQAFIPGSQITLNIESDFEKWDGMDVETFITNLAVKPGTNNVTIACSAKEYLRFLGNIQTIQLFKDYTENNKAWKEAKNAVRDGNITGICKSQNKSGVFVEIPSMGITGMVPIPREELTQYKPGPCKVHITGFDELVRFNKEVGQMQHVEPWKIEDNILKRINVKCVLEFVQLSGNAK